MTNPTTTYGLDERGFTLIEVMIAVGILAGLTGLMWMSIGSMFRTRDIVEERTARFQQVRITMNRMTTEIGAAYIAGPEFGAEELPGEETFGLEGDGDDEDALLASNQDEIQLGFIGREDELSFSSFAHIRTDPRSRASNHAEIGYFIRTDRDRETGRLVKQLMRREDATTDDDLRKGGVIYTMLPEVESVKFEYWDAGKVELGTLEEIAQGRWVTEWDTTRRDFAGRLPTRVRITLELPPTSNARDTEIFTTQAQIYVTEVLEF